uniref:Uncharacterized protein n=1 Tax=viral metagenome TaxID=1070528 RepID=A0A6C0C918_9ZZZZ
MQSYCQYLQLTGSLKLCAKLLPRFAIGWRFACEFNRLLKLLPRFAIGWRFACKVTIKICLRIN